MKCVKARTIVLAKDIGQFESFEIGDAEQHIAGCQLCHTYLQYNDRFQQFTKKRFSSSVTPPEIRELILDTLAAAENESANTPRTTMVRKWMMWAAVLAVGVIGGIAFLLNMTHQSESTARQLVSLLIQDQIASQMRENPFDVQTSDRVQLEQWFAKRVDFAVSIPLTQDAALRGGRLCYLLNKRVAFVVFEKESKLISAYILDGDGIDLSSLGQTASKNAKRFCRWSERGFNAILWNSNGLIYALVSSIDPDELEALVSKI